MKKIKFLNDNLVQKIAAGESIDRPCSILCELLDNSIDSSATKIEVSLEDGGITQILVEDNGEGISPEDLKICYKPHSTSKISEEQDLEKIETLGFRGEALASISVCANLQITSSTDEHESYQIEVEDGKEKYFIKQAGINGTIVNVSNIFHNFPARKRFLKKDAIEAKMCVKIFEEKAVAHPEIEFKLNLNKELRQAHFTENLLDRVQSIFGSVINNNKFGKIEQEYENARIKIFIAPPSFSKKDKRNIKVFVNKRAVDEKALVQALINGHRRVLSPGNFPICYLFLEVNPKYIDFNIHPQKKEVKFFNLPFLFQQISNTVDKFFDIERSEILKDYDDIIIKRHLVDNTSLEIQEIKTDDTYKQHEVRKDYETMTIQKDNKITNLIEKKVNLDEFYTVEKEIKEKTQKEKIIWNEFINLKEEFNLNNEKENTPKFIGQVSEMFLISEYKDEIYFIDQHALHEKIIYDNLRTSESAPQKLLTPIEFMVDDTEIEKIVDNEIKEYKSLNITITKINDKIYQLETIPNFCFKYEHTIIDFIKERESRLLSSVEASLYANIACRRAIKKGDIISTEFAKLIIEDFHKMEIKHCPHGRKIYHKISKKDLEKEVSRK